MKVIVITRITDILKNISFVAFITIFKSLIALSFATIYMSIHEEKQVVSKKVSRSVS